MKKITLLLFAMISFWQINAQVNSYSFSQNTGTYTPITGGAVLGVATNDDTSFPGLPIGFTFNFNSVDYTQFSVNSNGFIALGATVSSSYTSLSSGTSNNVIAVFNADLQGDTTGELSYLLQGSSPNQTLTIQWKNYKHYGTTGAGDNYNFQIILHETSNVIDFIYGTVVQNATARTHQVGLRGQANTNFLNRTTATDWTTTNPGVTNADTCALATAIVPPSGLTFTWTPPTCPGSTGMTATNLSTNSATVTWIEPVSIPANGYEYSITSSTTPPTGSGTASATNSASVSSLTSNTTYYVYVRSICGSDIGTWVLVGNFKTLCDSVTEFIENFDSYPSGTTSLPDCWSRLGTSANVYITTGGAAPMSPANRLYMNISATTTAFAVLPPVSNLQADSHRLKLKAYCTTAGKALSIGYLTVPGDVTSFVEIEPIQLPSTNLASTQEFTIVPTAIPTGVNQLVISIVPGASTTVYIDDIKWEVNSTCIEPNTLSAANITNNSADLGWVVGGVETEWEIQYGLQNFTVGTGTTVSNVTANPYALNGLLANTTYQFYVRSICSGPVYSSWAGPFTFKTKCDDVTEFFENFDSYTTDFSTTMPDCWSRGGTSTSTYITTGSVSPMSPSNKLYMFASGTTPTEGYAILPGVSNLQANTHRLKFKAYATAADRFLEIGYLTDPSDVTTFVSLEEVTLPGTASANTQEIVFIPTGIPTGVKYLAIKNPGFPSSSTTAYIDDVAWEVIPACSNPTNVSASAVTSNTATINWTANATDVSWEIEYGAPGFTLGSGTIVAASTNPFALSGLSPQTTYQFYVRSICSGPVTSSESLPGNFTTLCAPFTPDYTEDFTTFVPLCWNRSDAGDATTGPTGTGTGYWFADGFLNSGTTGAIKANLYLPNRKGWMISPILDLTNGGYQVRYDVGATNYANNTTAVIGSDDKVQFLMSTNGGSTWTVLETFNVANAPTNVSTTKVYDISAQTSSSVLFAFLADEGPVDDPQDWEFFVDNFVVETPPATIPACATNVVGTPDPACGNNPFTITWDATPSTLGYKINVGTTTGGTDIANNVDLGLVTTYTYGTPNNNTTYYYTVIPYNSIGDATGCTEQSLITFATGCACTPVYTTGTSDGDLISNVVITGTTLANNSGTTPGGPSYTYFTGQPNYTATLQAGASYAVEVTVGSFGSQNVAVWIDYNDNLIFEASEKVGFTTASIAGNGTATFNISLACSPPLGVHKMRVRDVYATSGSSIDPCNSYGWGETEDYDVTVAAAVACPQPSNLAAVNITSNSADLTWNIGCAETMWDLHLTAAGGGAPTGAPSNPNVSSPFMASSLTPETAYEFYVRADCQANGASLWTGPFTFTTSALPPANDNCSGAQVLNAGGVFGDNAVIATNVAATDSAETAPGCAFYQGGDVWYSVVVPASGSITIETNSDTGSSITDTGMAVYSGVCGALVLIECDDDDSLDGAFSLITLTAQTPGTLLYVNAWEYGNDVFGTFKISAYDASLSTSNFDNASFIAYPNPVKDVLNLSYSSEISSVSVINLLGQEVISKKIGNTSTQIDMATLTAGAYIVNVTLGDIIKSIKVIKQ
jgi:hypothetical protein